eukprot:TRINITY_DN6557_c0_g1_i1.p1 TRINITY_DN6557_c0_g1~~TRINITY_DN6557_c0_g1_i1.p1  ORF type:complete len:880 (+),score=284.07 TRINITY_DN6557_c0_g1_i1:104-2641(+)
MDLDAPAGKDVVDLTGEQEDDSDADDILALDDEDAGGDAGDDDEIDPIFEDERDAGGASSWGRIHTLVSKGLPRLRQAGACDRHDYAWQRVREMMETRGITAAALGLSCADSDLPAALLANLPGWPGHVAPSGVDSFIASIDWGVATDDGSAQAQAAAAAALGEDVAQRALRKHAGSAAPAAAELLVVRVILWADGFEVVVSGAADLPEGGGGIGVRVGNATLPFGELQCYEDPRWAPFVKSIRQLSCPQELPAVAEHLLGPSARLHLDVTDRTTRVKDSEPLYPPGTLLHVWGNGPVMWARSAVAVGGRGSAVDLQYTGADGRPMGAVSTVPARNLCAVYASRLAEMRYTDFAAASREAYENRVEKIRARQRKQRQAEEEERALRARPDVLGSYIAAWRTKMVEPFQPFDAAEVTSDAAVLEEVITNFGHPLSWNPGVARACGLVGVVVGKTGSLVALRFDEDDYWAGEDIPQGAAEEPVLRFPVDVVRRIGEVPLHLATVKVHAEEAERLRESRNASWDIIRRARLIPPTFAQAGGARMRGLASAACSVAAAMAAIVASGWRPAQRPPRLPRGFVPASERRAAGLAMALCSVGAAVAAAAAGGRARGVTIRAYGGPLKPAPKRQGPAGMRRDLPPAAPGAVAGRKRTHTAAVQTLHPGMAVRVRPDAEPRSQWGGVTAADIGEVRQVDGEVVRVAFSRQRNWTGMASELEPVQGAAPQRQLRGEGDQRRAPNPAARREAEAELRTLQLKLSRIRKPLTCSAAAAAAVVAAATCACTFDDRLRAKIFQLVAACRGQREEVSTKALRLKAEEYFNISLMDRRPDIQAWASEAALSVGRRRRSGTY